MASYDTLKAECTALEAALDRRLHQDGKASPADAALAGSTVDPELGGGSDEAARLAQIDALLRKFSEAVQQLGAAVSAEGGASTAARVRAAVAQRFREVLAENRAEFRSLAAAARTKREADALVAEMQGRRSGGGGNASAEELLLRERGSLQSSHRAMDELLAKAASTQEALHRQRSMIGNAGGRLGGLLSLLPGASDLIGRIGVRRQRNDTVLALTIAACVCFTIWWLFLR